MKKSILALAVLGLTIGGLTSCGKDTSKVITVCASEVPHAKILNECIKNIVEEDGYELEVKVLDWTLQNDAVANNDYDANYFQHVPYLNTYTGSTKLIPACKVHYEKLCLYAASTSNMTLDNGETIEIVNDSSNILRALNLLASHDVLTINSSNYDADGNFTNFDTANPNSCVTFKTAYANCSLTCISEAQLCASLNDYSFGIMPGNTAMTGLGDTYASRIVWSESTDEATVSERANIIAVKEDNKDSDKTKELVKAFGDSRVSSYISTTFGNSVLYHYENLIDA